MASSVEMQQWLPQVKKHLCEKIQQWLPRGNRHPSDEMEQSLARPRSHLSDEMEEWLAKAKSDLSDSPSYDRAVCIFSAPRGLLKECEDAYVPRIVSIGPYHFGKEELRDMERFKGDASRRQVIRIQRTNPSFIFDELLLKVFRMLGKISHCYDKAIPTHIMDVYDNKYNAMCWIIARDACFILEFFRSYISHVENRGRLLDNGEDYEFPEFYHPVFGFRSENHVVKSEIMRDLIKLENQIPLFVLEEVLAMEMEGNLENARARLQFLLDIVFRSIYYRPFEFCADERSYGHRRNHILDIYYYYCLGDEEPQEGNENLEEERQRSNLPSAVELKNGGVKIQALGKKVEDVKFEVRTLCIPRIRLDVDSEIYIRNLIGLEICSRYGPLKRMTAFAQFMNELCQTEEGAAVMRKMGVIVGNLLQHSEVTRLFSSCKHSSLLPKYRSIRLTRKALLKYYSRTCRTSSKILCNECWDAYVSKPWLLIGGIGATIILILTAIQVICLFHSCGAR